MLINLYAHSIIITILYGGIAVSTIYRLVSNEELLLWKNNNVENINNSIQNEGLFIPGNIYSNYKNDVPEGLSFYYKLEQILTGSLYQPSAYCIISMTLPDEILSKYAVAGYYFGYVSNGMKTAYEYLLPKEILKKYIDSFRLICDSDLLLSGLMNDFRMQDDSKNVVRKFAEWPDRTLGLYNSSNLGDLEWLLEKFFGTNFSLITNGLFFPSENYILSNKEKFDFSDENVGYYILRQAINDPVYCDLKGTNDQFIIPHPVNSVFGYLGNRLLEQGYETLEDLFHKKDEMLKYYIEGANQVFNTSYKKSKLLTKDKF